MKINDETNIIFCRKAFSDVLKDVKADFHLQTIFCGQKQNRTEKLMGMRVGHVNRKIFCSVLFRGSVRKRRRIM